MEQGAGTGREAAVPDAIVREANGAEEIAAARELMRAYGEHLAAHPAGAANICIQGYERELAGLPGSYAAPDGALLLAWVGGQAAGCVALKPLGRASPAEHAGERACEMKRLWVGPDFRGLGLGRTLVAAAMEWARAKGCEAMYLDTVPAAMPEAGRLYAGMGFERVSRYNDNPVADVVFFRARL